LALLSNDPWVTEAIGHVVPDTTTIEPHRNGGTASTRVAIDSSHGAHLEQRIVTYAPGRAPERTLDGESHAVMFVADGRGRLVLNGEPYELEPDTGVFAAAGETFAIENDGPEPLEVVEVHVPKESPPGANRRVLVRYRDRQDESAGMDRDFRCLVNEDAGIAEVTQFVGLIQPGRSAMHAHEYEEVFYVVEGEGFVHWDDGRAIAIRRGSCVHFPPLKLHTVENTGAAPMRVMGVLHPQLSPASRADRATSDPL
jgi:mannose-6-phosphate isomerase-like protein (cupin superfamily)